MVCYVGRDSVASWGFEEEVGREIGVGDVMKRFREKKRYLRRFG